MPFFAQSQVLYNNGATLQVKSGGIVHINGGLTITTGSTFNNNGTVKVTGNITNDVAENYNSGTLEFIGTSAQSLSGANVYKAKNVLINNVAGVTLNQSIEADGLVTFTNGIVSGSAPFRFAANGTHTSASDISHVNGTVVKLGTGSFDYPVGDGVHYQKASTNLTDNSLGMQVRYIAADAGVAPFGTTGTEATALVAYNPKEYWSMTPIGSATGSATIYWDAINNTGISNVSDLKVAHLSGGNWLNEGTSGSGTAASGNVTSNSVSTWSPFTLGSISLLSPLPIELISFSGKHEATANVLNWTTSQEHQNAYFTIQRLQNEHDFTSIGKVNSKAINGNSTVNLDYQFIDENFKTGHNYYRLLQTDVDGKTNLVSQVIDLYREANGNVINVYPNPIKDMLNVDCTLLSGGHTTIQLLDLTGRVIKEMKTNTGVGVNNIQITTEDLVAGMYLLQVIQPNQNVLTQKVEKRN